MRAGGARGARPGSHVRKGHFPQVLIERVGVLGKVGHVDVKETVGVIVSDGDAHAGLRLAEQVERRS